MNSPFFDVIVVGLGAMGSAALYQLSKRGVSVLGIDQFSPPHSLGSSHGDTRITRQAIGEGEAYTPLALRSYQLWQQIQNEAGDNSLLTVTGGLILSAPNTTGLHGKPDFIGNTRRSAQKYHIAHEILTAGDVQARYSMFRLQGDETGYFEPGAGFLRPERCITAQLTLARQNGAHLHAHEKVHHFSQNAGGVVTVQTDKQTYHCQKLIVTAGPWVSEFLPPPARSKFTVYRQVLYWFDVSSNYPVFAPPNFPVFIWDFGGGESIYGFPAVDGKKGGLKVAHEEYTESTEMASVRRTVSDGEIKAMYENFVAPRLAGVEGTCVKSVCCLYTVTPNGNFVIDTHPDYHNVLIASPCSGHGFKHSAAIGEILAQKAVEGNCDLDISAFAWQGIY